MMKPTLRTATWMFLACAGLFPAQVGAQRLLAWPIGSPHFPHWLLPGRPLPPLPNVPRPRPGPAPIPLPGPVRDEAVSPVELTTYRVDGHIEDQAAAMTIHLTFRNPTSQRLEGVLLLPIPGGAAVSGFSMTVGGKKTAGELLEADKASSIYQSIVSRMRDPGLLELVGERMVRARVFPIEPNGEIQAQLTLTQVLPRSGNLYSLSVPVGAVKSSLAGSGGTDIRLALKTTRPLRALYSPTAGVELRRDGDRAAEIRLRARPDGRGDLGVFYSMADDPLAAGVLAYREEGEDGYFMVSLSPKPQDDAKALPKDVVFVVDRSGSMEEGGKMQQARAALSWCLRRLAPQDRFGIVDFATETNSFETRLVAADEANKARGLRYVSRLEATGGTNISGGLEEGLRLLSSDPGRVPMVFFLTDGLPTSGETDVAKILASARDRNGARARLFAFGVGSDVNTLLLDKLAEANRGTRDYVSPGEDIEHKVSTLYQKVSKPVLSDVRFGFEGLETAQVYPRPTDLFHGQEVTLLGRYRAGAKGKLVVTGSAGGRAARFEFPVDLPSRQDRTDFLPRLWASVKVAHELDAIRLSGRADPEVVAEIVRLAKRHGIVTPYTSYLVTEEGADFQASNRSAMRQVQALSADAAGSGFSGGATRSRMAQKASGFFSSVGGMMAEASPAMPGRRGPGGGGGGGGVALSMARAELEVREDAERSGTKTVATRNAGGKTFYRRGDEWVDGEWEFLGRPAATEIKYLGPEYFELLAREPEVSRYFAIGSRVTVLHRGKAYRVVD